MVCKMFTELVEAELAENVKFNSVLQNTSPLYFTMNVEHNGMSMIILFCNLQDLNFWSLFRRVIVMLGGTSTMYYPECNDIYHI